MHQTLPKYFGLTIAFLAPGLLGVYGLSFSLLLLAIG